MFTVSTYLEEIMRTPKNCDISDPVKSNPNQSKLIDQYCSEKFILGANLAY
jgi:hypothetical protein